MPAFAAEDRGVAGESASRGQNINGLPSILRATSRSILVPDGN